MLSLLCTLAPVAADTTSSTDAGSKVVSGDVVTAEIDLDFLEFLGGADNAPPDPDAPYDDPGMPSGRDAPAPTEKEKVTP